jgi:hypothetical protein
LLTLGAVGSFSLTVAVTGACLSRAELLDWFVLVVRFDLEVAVDTLLTSSRKDGEVGVKA